MALEQTQDRHVHLQSEKENQQNPPINNLFIQRKARVGGKIQISGEKSAREIPLNHPENQLMDRTQNPSYQASEKYCLKRHAREKNTVDGQLHHLTPSDKKILMPT